MNITKINNSPEVYSITSGYAKRKKVSEPWKSSGTRSGNCERITLKTVTAQRVNPNTGEWEKYVTTQEVREPFHAPREYHERKTNRVTVIKTMDNDYATRMRIQGTIGNVE